ncbi:MAG: hypothetical protein K8T20_13445 [Planctomycetes bacterium]|nr:hypothetical protein [Planctomycetota bacterium]
MKKPLLGIVALALIAGIVTGSFYFTRGNRTGTGPEVTGKLSSKLVALESKCKEAFDSWKAHQDAFRAKKEFPALGHLNETFTNLTTEAKGLKGETPAETAALPHLISALELSQKVASTFIMYQVNETMVKPESWEKAKREAAEANAAWDKWRELTKGLSR